MTLESLGPGANSSHYPEWVSMILFNFDQYGKTILQVGLQCLKLALRRSDPAFSPFPLSILEGGWASECE